MTSPWYALPVPMPVNEPVYVRWAGWEGEAVFFRAKPADKPRWMARVRQGKAGYAFKPLPSAAMLGRDGRSCGPAPDALQPIAGFPVALGDPLPHLPHHDRRLGTIGGVAFSATDAAEEMESAREDARRTRDAPTLEALPWWREPSDVTYSPPGQITEREAEGRVMRALYFLGGDEHPKPYRTNAAVLADMKHAFDVATKQDATASYVPRLNTTLRDSPSELLAAMEWFCELALGTGWKTSYALRARAKNIPDSFAVIAVVLGTKDQRGAHNADTRGIARVHDIANAGHTPRLDAIRRDTKEGNRSHALTR